MFGFARRYVFIRRFGLGMAALSVVKLFLVDLASLTEGYRILSYFALGVTLIAISFVYQFFSKRLELDVGGLAGGGADEHGSLGELPGEDAALDGLYAPGNAPAPAPGDAPVSGTAPASVPGQHERTDEEGADDGEPDHVE